MVGRRETQQDVRKKKSWSQEWERVDNMTIFFSKETAFDS